jgi:hypothetical protein
LEERTAKGVTDSQGKVSFQLDDDDFSIKDLGMNREWYFGNQPWNITQEWTPLLTPEEYDKLHWPERGKPAEIRDRPLVRLLERKTTTTAR